MTNNVEFNMYVREHISSVHDCANQQIKYKTTTAVVSKGWKNADVKTIPLASPKVSK